MGNLVAMIVIMAASNWVLLYIFGWVGIPISVALAVLVFLKRKSRVLRHIALAIGVIVMAVVLWQALARVW
jgi:hypothetical protein